MKKTFTIHPSRSRSHSSSSGEHLSNELKARVPPAFSALYDQYAPTLLGVITKIVRNENEASLLLEVTFTKVRSRIDEFRPEKQPLFVWLLSIARCTAIDALKQRKALNPSAYQLTTSGRVIVTPSQPYELFTQPSDLQRKELLDAVLFKNCTPEEAAASLGIPVGLARQQLRLAMQHLRASQKLD